MPWAVTFPVTTVTSEEGTASAGTMDDHMLPRCTRPPPSSEAWSVSLTLQAHLCVLCDEPAHPKLGDALCEDQNKNQREAEASERLIRSRNPVKWLLAGTRER